MRTETDEPETAAEWRCRQLRQAGFPLQRAAEIASDSRFDLHALLELVERGCPPELALRILAPLGEEKKA